MSNALRRAQTRRVPYRLSNRNHLVDKFERDGTTLQVPPGVLTNLIESLFLVGIHRFDLGEDACTGCTDILADLVADYITEGAT